MIFKNVLIYPPQGLLLVSAPAVHLTAFGFFPGMIDASVEDRVNISLPNNSSTHLNSL